MRQFRKINIEISNICNLQCSFCPEVLRHQKMVSPEEFRHTIEQVAPMTRMVALHLMGDPLVHPQLEELVRICAEHEMKIFFVSNGVLLREKEMEILLHPAIHQVSFSLHSFHDNFPEKEPSVYLDRIFRFTERAFTERPELYLNYRLWNLKEPRGQQPQNRLILERIEAYFGIAVPEVDTRVDKSVPIRQRLFLHFDRAFTWPSLDLPEMGSHGTCHGLKSHFGVLVDGTVVPCCLDKEGTIPLGNLHQNPLRDILRSPRAQAMAQGFRAGNLVEDLCRRCDFIERFQT